MAENKSLETWLWDASCSIRGAQDAPKYKDFILPLVFVKRLCDVFDDEIDRIADRVGSREKAFKLVERDRKLVRFYMPMKPSDPEDSVWSEIRKLSTRIGEGVTSFLRSIAKTNPSLAGIVDRIDFNATTHGQRDIDDDRLSNLIEFLSTKRLGLSDVEPDIIGRSYEYLIRKFAEGSGKSAGEFYTPKEVGLLMAKMLNVQPGMDIYDPCCGSAGLLINCQSLLIECESKSKELNFAPVRLYGQEYIGNTWAMAKMNMIIHDMEGEIEIGDTFQYPKFHHQGKLRTFDRVVANPMWNQDWFTEEMYDADEFRRFPQGAGFPGKQSADWGWVQHILASLNENGQAGIVLDTGAASRGSSNKNKDKERDVRKWFIENDLVESVILVAENMFYNTTAPGIILVINKSKPIERQGEILLINAEKKFEKGEPKNFIPMEGIEDISSAFNTWEDRDMFCRVVGLDEVIKNDYNISPSRYIRTDKKISYRSPLEIRNELQSIELKTKITDEKLHSILNKLGF